LVGRVNVRLIIGSGIVFTAVSLWLMTKFSPEMSYGPVIWSGLLQGFGLTLIYVPLSAQAFATLGEHLRNEGAALFGLVRNLGSSIGISVVFFLLTRNTQTMHASLASLARLPASDPTSAAIAGRLDPHPMGLAEFDAMINHQSAFVAYLDDFRLLLVLTVVSLPFLLLLRAPRAGREVASHAVMD
jgi:DHA2 family multidrug resistance protein